MISVNYSSIAQAEVRCHDRRKERVGVNFLRARGDHNGSQDRGKPTDSNKWAGKWRSGAIRGGASREWEGKRRENGSQGPRKGGPYQPDAIGVGPPLREPCERLDGYRQFNLLESMGLPPSSCRMWSAVPYSLWRRYVKCLKIVICVWLQYNKSL